jgi:hypothetical protein
MILWPKMCRDPRVRIICLPFWLNLIECNNQINELNKFYYHCIAIITYKSIINVIIIKYYLYVH